MTTAAPVDAGTLDVWTDPEPERVGTSATLVTAVRTVAAVVARRPRRPARTA